MSLQDQLDAYKAQPKPHFPLEFSAIVGRTVADLVASGQAERSLKPGVRAPSFVLPNQDGTIVSSTDLLASGPLVISFYRGVWCPFCNIELKALEQERSNVQARGASLVAISQQTVSNNLKAQHDNDLRFPILSDKGGDTAAAFGLRWVVPEDMREVHRKLGVPLPTFNGEDSWTLPMPARYVIGQNGVIAYAEVNPDFTRRPEPDVLLHVIDLMTKDAAA